MHTNTPRQPSAATSRTHKEKGNNNHMFGFLHVSCMSTVWKLLNVAWLVLMTRNSLIKMCHLNCAELAVALPFYCFVKSLFQSFTLTAQITLTGEWKTVIFKNTAGQLNMQKCEHLSTNKCKMNNIWKMKFPVMNNYVLGFKWIPSEKHCLIFSCR